MAPKPPKLPLITIVGSTATGKSKVGAAPNATRPQGPRLTGRQLAIALARRFDGEVINGDAIQLYRGLPIATNQVRPGEAQGVPHHLLGCIGADEPPWTVGTFVRAAEAAIGAVRARGRLPIVVGGTHYYVQALLFPGLDLARPEGRAISGAEMERRWPILAAGNEAMLDELRRVDPAMAARWHPNDGRKIRRSLEIWLETGKRPSDIYAAQQASTASQPGVADPTSTSAASHCKHDSLLFWTRADQAGLEERIRQRVDGMIEEGLLDEIAELAEIVKQKADAKTELDTSKGIWAAIGYKEFEQYLHGVDSGIEPSRLEQLRADAIERVKIATRQYAKRQTRWIRLKLLPAVTAARVQGRFFALDCSRLQMWKDDVEESACRVTGQYLAGYVVHDSQLQVSAAGALLEGALEHGPPEKSHARTCQLCNVTTTTRNDWDNHVKSKRHKGLSRLRARDIEANTAVGQEPAATKEMKA